MPKQKKKVKSLSSKKKYCSLDIETSGFDPLTCEILEVGFAFFELTKDGIKITEEFTQVFKPVKEVPAAILGLTGITRGELENAPQFKDFHDILQEKLGDAVIVGHNIVFDVRFLESFGIKFSGETLDTLDLVQFILPTHHSYNLENLMHFFKVPHKEAHRALADAKATLVVLEKLLRLYCGYPQALKSQVNALIADLDVSWKGLLNADLAPLALPLPERSPALLAAEKGLSFKAGNIYNFVFGENYLSRSLAALKAQRNKSLLVVPKDSTVLKLWKEGLVAAVFSPEAVLDEERLGAFLKKKEKTADEIRFLLKVLVWKYTNWQHECLLDLNLSFFGGQFKEEISGGKMRQRDTDKIVCCSQSSFCELSGKGQWQDRLTVIEGLAEFEQYLSSGLTAKVSWSHIAYLLRSFYNPDLNTGNVKLKTRVEEILKAADLFFGLAGAYFLDDPAGFKYVKVTEDLVYTEKFQQLAKAADGFAGKLEDFAATAGSKELMQAAEGLRKFFVLQPEYVHWLELGENRCVFNSAPLNIVSVAKDVLGHSSKIVFVDSLGSGKILSFYIKRLGLVDFKTISVGPRVVDKITKENVSQGELFSGGQPTKVICHYLAKTATNKELTALLGSAALPAAVLMGTTTQVRSFYEEHYPELKSKASVLVNTHSGGSNKLFHNFSINPRSILVVTDKFLLKFLGSASNLEPVKHLRVKTLVICHLPFEQFSHPYQEALTAQLNNAFLDYGLPKAVHNLHRLLQFFKTSALETIYLWDAKLSKGYAEDFLAYLKDLPGVEVVCE